MKITVKTCYNTMLLIAGSAILSIILFSPDKSLAKDAPQKLLIKDSLLFLDIPPRDAKAVSGSTFAAQMAGKKTDEREQAIIKQILSGNVPSFARKMQPVTINQRIANRKFELHFFVTCDYMAVGSDTDYLYIPLTPGTAQKLATQLNCILPTKKMVDSIYAAATIKLRPQPIPPSQKMTTMPLFYQHTDSIKQQLADIGYKRSAGLLLGGHKKDIIISNKIYSPDRSYARVVIYGWHYSVTNPIQPVYNGHSAAYADYSHGLRLIANQAFLNQREVKITQILTDSTLSAILSDEDIIYKPFYPAF